VTKGKKRVEFRTKFEQATEMRIPAKMTGHSGEDDRSAHRSGTGVVFLSEMVTISQGRKSAHASSFSCRALWTKVIG
jgi:hypothetical protein